MSENLEISKDGYLKLIKKVYQNKNEERELALDRYRKADEQMESMDQFIMAGKSAVSYLNLACLSTNDLAALAKEIKSIVYKDSSTEVEDESLSDNWKNMIQNSVEEIEKTNRRKIED